MLLALLVGASTTSALPGREKPLSQNDRLKIFDQVWDTIRDKYYDPTFNGVNWDLQREKFRPLAEHAASNAEFYGYLKLMVGELRDSHTRLHTPGERENRENNSVVTAGIDVFEVEGQTAVVEVAPRSEAERAGIRPGMLLTAIDGVNIRTILARLRARSVQSSSDRAEKVSLYRTLLTGPPGAKLRLTFEDQRHETHELTVELTDTTTATHLEWRRLAGGIGYITFNRWEGPVAEDFRKALDQLSSMSRLIIDLRGNSGGSGRVMHEIANLFFKDPVSFGEYIPRKGRPTIVKSFPMRKAAWSGSIAVLLDEASRSSSELFAAILQEHQRAIVVGRQSCGCVLGVSSIKKLRDGGELTVSEIGVLSPAGHRLELVGVMPDIEAPLHIRDLIQGRDAVLDAAVAWLTRQPVRQSL